MEEVLIAGLRPLEEIYKEDVFKPFCEEVIPAILALLAVRSGQLTREKLCEALGGLGFEKQEIRQALKVLRAQRILVQYKKELLLTLRPGTIILLQACEDTIKKMARGWSIPLRPIILLLPER